MKMTKQYIAMVSAAAEIQAMRPACPDDPPHPMRGRYDDPDGAIGSLFHEAGHGFACLHWDNDEGHWMIGGYHDEADAMKWIPRLDDLLPMLGRPDDLLEKWMDAGGDISASTFYHGDFQFNPEDWHEPALMLVMHEKYRKKWNGKEWEAEG